MMEWSRASGRDAAMLPIEWRTQAGAAISGPQIQPHKKAMRNVCAWAGALAIAVCSAAGARAQENTTQEPPASTVKLTGGVSTTTYTDSASADCEETNTNNPYAGMNPLVCYGEMAPQASNGACDLGGWQVWKHVGETCYYCAPMNPPIVGIIIPMDQVGVAESQGWGCGEDQADACMAICQGGSTYTPPAGTTIEGGPGLPPTPAPAQGGPPPGYAPQPGPAGGEGYVPGPNPCIAGGGYNYCNNGPGARLPAGCVCSQTDGVATQGGTNEPSGNNPDPNNQFLGVMVGISNCIQNFPNVLRGIGYASTGDWVDAATMWGISPKVGGPTILQKELAVPVIGNNGKTLVPNNLTPYQQGVIDGQRLCGYTVMGTVAKGAGAAAGKVVGSVGKVIKGQGGVVLPGEGVGGTLTPGEGTPAGGGTPEPTPPGDNTVVTNPPVGDSTVNTNPAPGATEPTPIAGGESAGDPVEGNALKGALTNEANNVANNAQGLANKYVELEGGAKQLGDYVGQGSFAAVWKSGTNMVRKLAKNSGAGYFNDQIEGQANGSQTLQKLGIDHPEVTEVEGGTDETPGSLVQENATTKYPNSAELSSAGFQKAGAAMQGEILGALQNFFNKLAANGYIMGDINPANFRIGVNGSELEAIPQGPDMVMSVDQLNTAMKDPTSYVPSTLNGSLAASGAPPYAAGAYASAQALANQLFSGMENWLKTGPPAQ